MDGGAAAYRIGTTSATTINLEDCLGCGLSGWGWQDNGWDVGVMGPNISFQSSGAHTIRVQVREDGLSIDQIVLSPSTYLNASPGPLRNDTTILPGTGGPPPNPAPTVSSVSPNTGPESGGTSVTITGTGFLAGAGVSVGGVAASNVAVAGSTSITAVTPSHPAGSVSVTVTNFDGQSGTSTNAFTFAPVTPMPQFGHVFIVVEENHSYSSVIGSSSMPYLNGLASRYGLATNYYANTHPSIGNYFWLTTGQNITDDSDFAGTVTADNLVRQALASGKTWKSYAESLPAVGYAGGDQYPYVKRHNPFAYISDVINSSAQLNNLVPFSQFAGDLSNNQLSGYSFIIPNQYNNAHDCTPGNPSCTDAQKLAAADDWLRINIGPLLGSAVFQQDGLCVILFDESVDTDTVNGGGQIAMLVISPRAKPGYRSATFFQHQSTLRMMAQALGLTILPGAAATAPDMTEFFDTSSSPTPSLSTISPNSGASAGGTSVTITGSGFAAGATVMTGGVPATKVNVLSSTSITSTTPAHSTGSVNVTVTNTNGRGGTLSGGYTYTITTEAILLADDFNDNSLDPSKWIAGNVFSGFTDASLPVRELNQRLEIGPLLRNRGDSHYNGIRSAAGYDFTGSYCYVGLVQPGASTTSADAMLTIGVDVNNYYRIYVEAGNLIVQRRINGSKATLSTASYDSLNHRYLRIRHEAASGKVVFETAPDSSGSPGAWIERYRESWNAAVALGGIQFELKAGTFTAESVSPGLVVFDNFKAARP
jgi:acid phosphatase